MPQALYLKLINLNFLTTAQKNGSILLKLTYSDLFLFQKFVVNTLKKKIQV